MQPIIKQAAYSSPGQATQRESTKQNVSSSLPVSTAEQPEGGGSLLWVAPRSFLRVVFEPASQGHPLVGSG